MSGPCLFVHPRRIRRGAALTLVFVSVLATGAAVGSWGAEPGPRKDPEAAGIPARTYVGAVESDQVKAAAAEAEEDGKSGSKAAREVVSRSGDRWGAVYSAREYEGFRQNLDGAYVGVGISARRDAHGRIAVERVEPGSPAEKAGIRAGDRLRTVDHKNVTGRPVTEVVALLRGPADGSPGTRVELGLRRGTHEWTEELRRARLTTDPVTVDRLSDHDDHRSGAVRIKVDSFTKGTGERIRHAVRSTPRGDGILLDLRGNSGGLVSEAVTAASSFLDGGLVATYDVRGDQRVLDARPGGDTGSPLVVLVDGGTMSAAELLTGALQDRGRAVVVGSRTFGKGSVQMPSELPDGSVAELTVGHYRTPAGRNVDGEGIAPDLAVKGDDGPSAEARARTVLSGLGGGS
ncbi:S41 family peptidase [Streptomyces malaysiensis]|uniref:Peptidase S41 n=1 Tax=Streptomyces autolyticus TaxID=75293 RepID=A0ABM6HE93_9ACTN|nr:MULTISPECIES: S41 family peptidase [Streptomyces]AQA12214.1 peptidase S41 [Streptomyces autolyticus]AUA13409.1 putative CtpA-like serine protease [Streptomyces sp. M56]MCC4319643.1 PDZ domain-containing protein [Streptomyces malaysiensis]MYX55878.1 PDZ domain-containing protein [Streptomyces sp. SID8382]